MRAQQEALLLNKQQLYFFFQGLPFTTSHSLPLTMTRGGEHDPVDPSLIVKSSQVSQPSKRILGVDYLETVGNTVQLKSGANSSKG